MSDLGQRVYRNTKLDVDLRINIFLVVLTWTRKLYRMLINCIIVWCVKPYYIMQSCGQADLKVNVMSFLFVYE